MGKPQHGSNHTQQAAVKAHAPRPDRKDFQGMAQVITGFVKQTVAQAPANNHPQHPEKEDVLHILAAPGLVGGQVGKGRVLQAAQPQQHEQAKRCQVRQPIPVHGQRPQLQGHGVDVWVHQHGTALYAWAG